MFWYCNFRSSTLKKTRFLLEKYHLNPEECLFIDDDDTGKNYETANKIGIQGRRIVPNQLEDIINLLSEYDVRF